MTTVEPWRHPVLHSRPPSAAPDEFQTRRASSETLKAIATRPRGHLAEPGARADVEHATAHAASGVGSKQDKAPLVGHGVDSCTHFRGTLFVQALPSGYL